VGIHRRRIINQHIQWCAVPSFIRGLSDAVANSLSAISWPVAGTTVERRNWAAVDLLELESPVILVAPGSVEVSRVGRLVSQIDYTVNVFVGMRCNDDAAIDSTIDLADSVALHIRAHDWPEYVSWPEGATSPNAVSIDIDPESGLNERNVWRAMISATYRIIEADRLPE